MSLCALMHWHICRLSAGTTVPQCNSQPCVSGVHLPCSDALFLDLALEGTARRAVEAALPSLRAAAASEAGSTGSSGGSNFGSGATAPEGQLRRLLQVAATAAVCAAQSAAGDAELAVAVRGVQVGPLMLPLLSAGGHFPGLAAAIS
jgi:hypothetical protein